MVSTVSFGIARTYHTIFSFFPCHFRSLHSFFHFGSYSFVVWMDTSTTRCSYINIDDDGFN